MPDSILRKRPLTGPKMPFFAPLPASKRMREAEGANPDDRAFCRILAKDAIGNFLGLPRAPYRVGTFGDAEPLGDALNVNRRFMVNEKTGAKQWVFTLKPGTQILQGKYNWDVVDGGQQELVYMKHIEIYAPSHIGVNHIMFWIENATNQFTGDDNQVHVLETYTEEDRENLLKIIAIRTPNERTYNIRSSIYEDAVPEISPVPVPSPSPSPGPAPNP